MGCGGGQERDCGWRMELPWFLLLRWGFGAGPDAGRAAGGDKNLTAKMGCF